MRDVDLIIVGAGPAGTSAALAALRSRPSATVVIVDRAPSGRDKICGDGIAPQTLDELRLIGVEVAKSDDYLAAVQLVSPTGIRMLDETSIAGAVIPRARFDAHLLAAAIEAGAEFIVHRVTEIEQDDSGVTVDSEWRAPILIGADGSNSTVRRLTGQSANHGRSVAVAIRGYAPTPPGLAPALTIRWDSHRDGGLCYAWAFPVADGTTNVGYGMSAAAPIHTRAHMEKRMHELLPEYDFSGVHIAGHTLPLSISRPEPVVGRILLTGDAASLINPFTGEGIFSAVVSGALAGVAAVEEPESAGGRYARELAARFGRQHRQLTTLYRYIDRSWVLDAIIRACGRDHRMFERLFNVGLADGSFDRSDLLRFGRFALPGPFRAVSTRR